MKMNLQIWRELVKQGSNKWLAKSREILRRIDPPAQQDVIDFNTYDESILQQGRFWIRTVTWVLVGSSVFGVAWLARVLKK